ncbi:MAG: DUF1844 domain-containing protein [Candidatus Binatia bacterium]
MAGEGEKEEGKSFKVQDRRRFSSDTGEPREEAEPSDDRTESSDEKIVDETPSETNKTTDESLPQINFSTFLMSLSTQALMHLGEIASPLSGKVEIDVPVAKQMIDIIGVLREKTRGNLDKGEDDLLEGILYDLRMKYVEAAKSK